MREGCRVRRVLVGQAGVGWGLSGYYKHTYHSDQNMAKTREKPKVKSTRTLTKRHEEVLNQILKALRTLDSKLTRKISRNSTPSHSHSDSQLPHQPIDFSLVQRQLTAKSYRQPVRALTDIKRIIREYCQGSTHTRTISKQLSLLLKKQIRNFFPELKGSQIMQLEEEADEARQAEIRERRWKRAEELLAAKGLMQKMARISKKRAHPSVSEVKIEPEDFIQAASQPENNPRAEEGFVKMELRSPQDRSSLRVENVSPRRGNDIPFRNAPLVLSEKSAGERSRNRYPRPVRMKKRMEEVILKRGQSELMMSPLRSNCTSRQVSQHRRVRNRYRPQLFQPIRAHTPSENNSIQDANQESIQRIQEQLHQLFHTQYNVEQEQPHHVRMNREEVNVKKEEQLKVEEEHHMKQLLESNHPNLLPDRTGEEVPESPLAREEYMFQLQKDEVMQMIGSLDPTCQQQVIALIRRNYPNSILDDQSNGDGVISFRSFTPSFFARLRSFVLQLTYGRVQTHHPNSTTSKP